MKKNIFGISASGVSEILSEDLVKETKSIILYEILCDDKLEVVEEFNKLNIEKEITDRLVRPSQQKRFGTFDGKVFGNIPYFSKSIEKPDIFMPIVITENKIFLAHQEENESFGKVIDAISEVSPKEREGVVNIIYIIFNELISFQQELILSYREEVETIAKSIDKVIISAQTDKYLSAKHILADFAVVTEKQFFTLSFPPTLYVDEDGDPYKSAFSDLLKSLTLLKSSITQTEQRLDSIYLHHMLLLQEKSNKRINFLTIIQAVFVPLTLIAGIYGMNFMNMPELAWEYGYFLSLGFMALIAVGFIRYFFKNGWFN